MKSNKETDTSGYCGEDLTWTLDDEGVLIIDGTGDMYDCEIEETCWKSLWGFYFTNIVSVVVNQGVTSIGEYTFAGCTGLTSIEISDSVESIGVEAFRGCPA